MNKIQNQSCPHCKGAMKPVFSIKDMECKSGSQPKFEIYISAYECDNCGHQETE